MKKQRGGTLLGIIIGTLIGLGAALAVAVYITKVPIPFMNKSQPRNPDGDAMEAKKNRDWNPNAGLAGKNAAKPPAPAQAGDVIAPDPDVVTAPKPAASAAAKVDKPVKPAKPAASADPLGDLANAKAQEPKASSGPDPFNYFIQAGAYRTPEDAEQQRARLLLLGMQARVTEREQSGRTVYRVRVGPFDKKDDAEKVKERLDNNSIETALVRVQR
ncbi:MAG: SPOR domain-containing protein [Polaromonas sp.]|jgi:cell division protein FtsN|nr:SPOR domain-containing protein [Polaromonas sp.]